MVFLGGPPAALIGLATMAIGWIRWRDAWFFFLNNLVAYAWFPLIGGLAFYAATRAAGVDRSDGFFYVMVFGVFALALRGQLPHHRRASVPSRPRVAARQGADARHPGAPVGAVGGAACGRDRLPLRAGRHRGGSFSSRSSSSLPVPPRRPLVSQQRSEELQVRTRQLATLQVGLLSALMHTLDLRDRMTARHSAAVARYAREIARAAGSRSESRSWSTPPASSTTSASSSSPTTSSRPT